MYSSLLAPAESPFAAKYLLFFPHHVAISVCLIFADEQVARMGLSEPMPFDQRKNNHESITDTQPKRRAAKPKQ